MRKLLVCVPTRGRPERLRGMLDGSEGLSEGGMDIAVGFDDDDPSRPAYEAMKASEDPLDLWRCGPRDTVSGWTNKLALPNLNRYWAFCVMNDDHVPRTRGWNRLLLQAIDDMGGTGIAYGNDLLQGQNLPTHWVMSADLVETLGWLMPSFLRHYHTDDVIRDIGRAAGCLAYVPGVVIEHMHPGCLKGQWDETYSSEAARDHEDLTAYQDWLAHGMDADVAKVTALLASKKVTA